GFANWLSRGRTSKQQLRRWFDDVRPHLSEVDVGGERSFVLAKYLDCLRRTKKPRAVRLLPGFDQFVMGPGTEDPHVIPAHRRSAVSTQSGWSPPGRNGGGAGRGDL